jgi:hypothetical protein
LASADGTATGNVSSPQFSDNNAAAGITITTTAFFTMNQPFGFYAYSTRRAKKVHQNP